MATKQREEVSVGAGDASGAAGPPWAGGGALVPLGGSGAVALPDELAAELEQYAVEAAAKERPKVSKISLKGGMMTYMGQVIPGEKMDVVVLAYSYRNTWYEGDYDPNRIVNPSCFAIQASDEDMRPHENVPEPQNETCKGCEKNEWGSDRRGGRGKDCKETRRLVIIPVDALRSIDGVVNAEVAVVDVPVTSVANFANYVNALSTAVKRPMWSVVTTLAVVRDPKTQFKLVFTPIQAIADVDLLSAIRGRLADALRLALIPYDEAYLAGKEPEATLDSVKPAKFKARK